jgi:hypothetical protein
MIKGILRGSPCPCALLCRVFSVKRIHPVLSRDVFFVSWVVVALALVAREKRRFGGTQVDRREVWNDSGSSSDTGLDDVSVDDDGRRCREPPAEQISGLDQSV